MSVSMLGKLALAIALVGSACGAPTDLAPRAPPAHNRALFHTFQDTFEPFLVPEVADSRVIPLTRHDLGDVSDAVARRALRLRERLGHDVTRQRGKRASTVDLESVLFGNEYIATIQIGNQSVKVIMDTGAKRGLRDWDSLTD